MLLYHLLFFFIAMGAKLCLALVMIYLLLPTDRRCNSCDGETLLLRMSAPGRLAARLSFARVQRRWCPGCGWQGLARVIASPPPGESRSGAPAPTRR